MSYVLLPGPATENWRAASPPGGTTLTVATLTETDRKSAGWAKNKNTISLRWRRTAWSLKTIFKMHGETDGSAWTDITNRRWMRYFSCGFCWFLSCLVIPLGHSVRKNYVRIFLVPPLRKVTTLQPSLSFSFWHSYILVLCNHSWF